VDPGATIFLELTDHAVLYLTPSAIALKWNPTVCVHVCVCVCVYVCVHVCVCMCLLVIRVSTLVKV
jgi:hypothetical protein